MKKKKYIVDFTGSIEVRARHEDEAIDVAEQEMFGSWGRDTQLARQFEAEVTKI